LPAKLYEDAQLRLKRGDLTSALAEAGDGLHTFARPDTEWHWRFTVLTGVILSRQRLWKESLELLAPDLPGYLAQSDIAVLRKLTQGYAKGFMGNLNESDKLFAEAEELAKEKHPELLGEIVLRRGTIAFFIRGDDKAAESLFGATLEMARQQQDPFLESNALGSLGLVATRQEHYDEAIDRFRGALKLSRSIGAESATIKSLGNLGWSYFEMGDYENALSLFQQAEQASEKSGLLVDQLYWQTNIGVADYYLHDPASAEKESRKALDLARRRGEREGITQCLNNLSSIAMLRGDVDLAEKYNNEALQLSAASSNRSGVLTSTLIAGQIESARQHYRQSEKLLNKVINDPSAGTALKWEAEARLAKVYAGERLPGKAEKEYQRSIATIETARSSVNTEEFRLTFLSSGIEFYDDYIGFLIRQERPADALQVAELSRARTLAEGLSSDAKANSPPTRGRPPQQLAKRLHATLLVYWLGEKHSYLWVIATAKTAYFTLPPASEIDALVKAYTQAIVDSKDILATNDKQIGEKLYATLIAPAQKLIPANSRVILLPDGSLYGLNFETLIALEPQPHFWIEDATLTTGSSLTLLTSSANRPAAKERNLLLVGSPKEANPEFPPLLQAPNEMKKVERYFLEPHRTVLEGERATPNAYLKSNPGRFSYLHFATHGTASRTRPLESAVVLSKEPGGDTYKLYARDIVTRHLQAELVTISACYGSGKRAYSGEGLVGLSWAFVRAGAHNVIGALWEVSDVPATPELMDVLYRELGAGKDPAAALRSAKLSLLRSTNPNSVFRKPFYWAPFQLYAGS
jgi:CHAT domain-containing protein/Tfp pilus assembly protein PilF